MSADWQPGDLALCVRGGFLSGCFILPEYPLAGRLYTVAGVRVMGWQCGEQSLGLILPEAPPNNARDHTWGAIRFRKIRPHTPDAEDAETIRLLNGAPVQEPVS